jgi:hypothetical protein
MTPAKKGTKRMIDITENKEQASLSLDPVVKSWLIKTAGTMTAATGRKITASAITNSILKRAMVEAGDEEDQQKLIAFMNKKVLPTR